MVWKFSELGRVRRLVGEKTPTKGLDAPSFLEGRYPHLTRLRIEAGIEIKDWKRLEFILFVAALLMVVLILLKVPVVGVALFAAVLGCLYVKIEKKSALRARAFESDFAPLLMSLASSLRTGIDPTVAMCESASLFTKGSVLRSEINSLKANLDQGMTEEVAFAQFGETVRHPDIELFREAFLLSRKHGASLGSALERLAKVTRLRQSFRRRVKAAIAMQRLSAIGVVLCGVSVALVQAIANPTGIMLALEHPMGIKFISFGVVMILAGLIWLSRMARVEV